MQFDKKLALKYLKSFQFTSLFIDLLGWDHAGRGTDNLVIPLIDAEYSLQPVANKQGYVAYHCPTPDGRTFPDHATRMKIDRKVTQYKREHIIIFTSPDKKHQIWQWVRRKPGQPVSACTGEFTKVQSGEAILQKLDELSFSIDDEEHLNLTIVTQRVERALNVDRVTKRFFDQFTDQHSRFLKFIAGINVVEDGQWYASVMLNRLMFIYFVQKKGFLDNNKNYLTDKLAEMQAKHGQDRFYSFYRFFLLKLFHEGLGKKERQPDLSKLIGKIPYLNGGLFDIHELEKDERYGSLIQIPDDAFKQIFSFFDQWQWHLDDRKTTRDNEINPDVLGYIFEKYINQKQMGAYYTKEDITEYISKNTIIPHLFESARKLCKDPFQPESPNSVWSLLVETPDRYIYDAVKKGHDYPLPPEIAQGLAPSTLSQAVGDGPVATLELRRCWNKPADEACALPTETWREFIARRNRYHKIIESLASGEIHEINDLITLNLDIRQFVHDVIESTQSPALLHAFWEAVQKITVLDPTCGSGAFLFAALNILEPIYDACLKRMELFVKENSKDHELMNQRFKAILAEVDTHPNRSYFILKAIILNNLFGVDIMEEATEICKLRLFLKLAAQVSPDDRKPNMGIEPLPDIDFNIRAGNTLVGYATSQEVENVFRHEKVSPKENQGLFAYGEDQDSLAEFRLHMSKLAQTMNSFRNNQQTYHFNPAQNRLDKIAVEANLKELRQKLDAHLAGYYGIDVTNIAAFAKWKKSHEPFHWFIEFYEILRKHDGAGGFDVVIGNPPYINVKDISYDISQINSFKFPDIYGLVVKRALDICSLDGRNGMIIPLSITFSSDFKELREIVIKNGDNWFSSFDNIPAAVFSGVSQRCTIWLNSKRKTESFYTSTMKRWRSNFRIYLVDSIEYFSFDVKPVKAFGIPKYNSTLSEKLIKELFTQIRNNRKAILKKSNFNMGFSQAARNFLSVFRKVPPCIDAISGLDVTSTKIGFVFFDNMASSYHALSTCSGEVLFYYWLIRGDGFDVTSWIIKDFLEVLNHLPENELEMHSSLASVIVEHSNEAIAFKKNAGKFVGNYNYRRISWATKRSDLLLLKQAGFCKAEVFAFFEEIQAILSVNEFAGEKSIPDEIRSKYQSKKELLQSEISTFKIIDEYIINHYGFTEEELDFIINYDIKYRMGRDSETETESETE